MRKTRFIALVLVAALMLAGAGYAAWTDTLVINNTVSTGELNVRFVDGQSMTRGGDNLGYWEAYVKHEGRLGGPTTYLSNNGKTVNTTVTNMYPGAYAQYYGLIENNGTIPAVVDDVEVTFTGLGGRTTLSAAEQELKDNMNFAFGYVVIDKDGNKVDPNPNSGDQRYYAWGTFDQMEERLNELFAANDVRLEPGQKLSLDFPTEADAKAAMAAINYPYNDEMHCITYTLSQDADNDTEKQVLGIHITMNWKQHNIPDVEAQ